MWGESLLMGELWKQLVCFLCWSCAALVRGVWEELWAS